MLILMQILVALLAYQQFRLGEQRELLEIAYHKDASVANESRMNNDNRGLEQRLTRITQSGLENLRIEMGHQLEILNTSIRDLELQISHRLSDQESKFYENWKEIRNPNPQGNCTGRLPDCHNSDQGLHQMATNSRNIPLLVLMTSVADLLADHYLQLPILRL